MGTTLIEEPGREPARKGTTLIGGPASGAGGTRLAEPVGRETAAGGADAVPAQSKSPVVGWLVIVDGPGKGRSLELGFGMNIIGRNKGNRIVLGFGDDQISGEDHFRVAFDGAHRKFHLVPGRGTNLVYLEGNPLLSPVPLENGNELAVGTTRLRFVALCGEDWCWGDTGS